MHSCTHSFLFKLHEQLEYINIYKLYEPYKQRVSHPEAAQDVKAARGQGLGISWHHLSTAQPVRNWIVAVVAYPGLSIGPCLSWSILVLFIWTYLTYSD